MCTSTNSHKTPHKNQYMSLLARDKDQLKDTHIYKIHESFGPDELSSSRDSVELEPDAHDLKKNVVRNKNSVKMGLI